MSIRVTSNTLPNNLVRQIQQQRGNQLQLQEQLARQQKITRASDDPLAFQDVKETQSQQRSMRAYRANLDRATLTADLTESSLQSLKDTVREALQTSDLLETNINDRTNMETSANLVDELLEQVFQTLNSKNGDNHLFSGRAAQQTPFEALRDEDGKISSNGLLEFTNEDDNPPQLVEGQTYIIEDNGTGPDEVDFTAGGAPNNDPGTAFTFDGGNIPWVQGGPAALSQAADAITEETSDQLIEGKAYEIQNAGANSKFTDSGAVNNDNGTQFIFNGEEPTFDGAQLIPLDVADEELIDDPFALEEGALFKIADNTSNGEELAPVTEKDAVNAPELNEGDTVEAGKTYTAAVAGDFSALTGRLNDGSGSTDLSNLSAGETFTATAAGNLGPGLQLREAPVQAGNIYRIEEIGDDTDLSGTGAPPSASAGDIFVGDGTQPTEWDGLKLKSLQFPTKSETLSGGDPLEAGTTVQITADPNGSDFSAVGGPDGTAGDQTVGNVITVPEGSTFTLPANVEAKELIDTKNDQTTLDEGESFVVGQATPSNFLEENDELTIGETFRVIEPGDYSGLGGTTNMQVGDTFTATATGPLNANQEVSVADVGLRDVLNNDLQEGAEYVIVDDGATADFTASGATTNNVGTTFTYNGTPPDFGSNGALVEQGGSEPISDASELNIGTTYEIVDNGNNADFTESGAGQNTPGTRFTFNGTPPNFGNGVVQRVYPDTDFTAAGAADNQPGTLFTSDGSPVDFGLGGEAFQLFPERTDATDFTRSGAESNEVGTVFTFNGTKPELGADTGESGAVVAFERERLAGAYVGSLANLEFKIAEDKDVAPTNDGKRNQQLEELINGMVKLRDAYQKAADSEEDDLLTRDIALERAKEATNKLAGAEEDVLKSISDMGVKQLSIELAKNKDDNLFNSREDTIGKKLDINETELITKLRESLNTFQASLQANSRSLQLSLLDFV